MCLQEIGTTLKNHHGTNNYFHLAGYSFGACVATEITLQLQQNASSMSSHKSCPVLSLVLLDGSHHYVQAQIAQYKAKIGKLVMFFYQIFYV